jgi:hypothetical protein
MIVRTTMPDMLNTPDAITEYLTTLRHRSGLSIKSLAVAMGYKNASSIQRYFDPDGYKGGYLHRDLVAKLVGALGGKGIPPITAEEVWELAGPEFAAAAASQPDTQMVVPSFGKKNLPVMAAAMGGDGHVIISFDPIEYIDRPSYLEHVPDAYGVYIVGDSMYPAYRPSDIAYVHPRLPPARDTDVVLFHTPPVANAECMIKQLNGWDDKQWHLEQFRPALEFKVDRVDWPICHRVLGRHNRR